MVTELLFWMQEKRNKTFKNISLKNNDTRMVFEKDLTKCQLFTRFI